MTRGQESNGLRQPLSRRLCDIAGAAIGLLILSPVLAALALAVLWRDGRPVLFHQLRVGRSGVLFRIWKFRTMRAENGRRVTAAGDPRVTALGAWLRTFKLDELPQLINVLRGDMSLIGPRPEVPEYVDRESPLWRAVLQVRPGITDPATLIYRHEEAVLAASANVETYYREVVLPEKLRLNLNYLRQRSLRTDLRLIWLTLRCCFSAARIQPGLSENAFPMGAGHGN